MGSGGSLVEALGFYLSCGSFCSGKHRLKWHSFIHFFFLPTTGRRLKSPKRCECVLSIGSHTLHCKHFIVLISCLVESKHCLESSAGIWTPSMCLSRVFLATSSRMSAMMSWLTVRTTASLNNTVLHSHRPFGTGNSQHVLVCAEPAQWLQWMLAAVQVLQLRLLLR